MLIDTSGWLCMLHKDEPEHLEAVRLYNDALVRVTHSYILAEFVLLAQVRNFHAKAISFSLIEFWMMRRSS